MVFVSPISGARRPDILKIYFFYSCFDSFCVNFFQELVTKVFQQMWFSPLKGEENSDVFVKRVVHMTDVVSAKVISLTFKSFSFI